MTNLITFTDIRNLTGIGDDIVSDAAITASITEVQNKVISNYKIYLTPTKVIEIKDGNNKNQININRPYIWKVLELKSRDNEIDLENVTINPLSGIISIDNTQSPYLLSSYKNSVKIKYLSAFMEKTTIITETTADVVAGTSVDITVDSSTSFTVDDWIIIEGTDGKIEACKVTAKDTGEITVDELVQTHESGSLVTKLQTHELLRQFVLYESGVMLGVNAVGGSYTFATSYTMPEYSTTLGVPHPHFSKMLDDLIRQRDKLKSQLMAKLTAMS
jgi:hypothetical protein